MKAALQDMIKAFPSQARKLVGKRMRERMTALQIDTNTLIVNSGVSRSTVYGLLNGVWKNPRLSSLIQVSRALDCQFDWLMIGKSAVDRHEVSTMTVIGIAELGAYRMPTKIPKKAIHDLPPIDERFRSVKRFAVAVIDDQLEGFDPPVHRGQYALFIDFIDGDLVVEAGRVYLLNRANGSGQIETAFWRAQVSRAQIEFSPMTRDAASNRAAAFTISHAELENSASVIVTGLLYGSTYRYF
jgi:transcriptional regulator with XRE-family HTH domain